MNAPHLHIHRLRVAQLRKFEAMEIEGLTAGFNIIAGPNGAGKSTLHRAIRAAFLDRYSANASTADLQPHDNSGAAPTVELDFTLHGVPHQLVKTFLKKKRCDLLVGTAKRSEQDAEDYLADALGFGFGARGGKPDVWGVPGLLWVEQGFAPEQLSDRVGYASRRLGAALHAQAPQADAGSLAATAGDALIAQLEEELAQYLGKTGKPIGAYAQLLERIAQQQTALQEQQQRIAEYRSQVDELQQLQADAQAQAAQPPEQAWQQALQEARARLEQAKAQQAQQAHDVQQLQQLDSKLAWLAQTLHSHSEQQHALQRRADAVAQAVQAHTAAQQQHAQLQQQLEQAQAQLQQAQAHAQQADQARQRVQMAQQWQDVQRQVQQAQAAQLQGQQALQQLQQLTKQLSGLNVEKTDIAQLRTLEEAVQRARLQRDAVATHVQFCLPAGQALPWQGAGTQGQWQGEGQEWLDAAFTLALPGGGQLTITPGGRDVAGSAQRLQQAQAALQVALQRCGVDSVAQAQAQWEQRQSLLAQQQLAQQALTLHAPQGLDALDLQLQQAQAHSQGLQAALQALPLLADAIDWHAAQAAQQTAMHALEQARVAEQSARQQLALAAQRLQSSQQEHAASAQQLNDPAAQARHAQAQQQAALLQAQRVQLQQQLERHAAAVPDSALRFAAQDIERLERTLTQHAQHIQARALRMASVRAALEQAGAQGLEEVCAQAEAALAHALRRAQEMERRSQALQTVVQRLKAKRSAALRRLQAPLEARMNHYLQLLLPGGSMQLDEQLVPRWVTSSAALDAHSARVAGEVKSLSYGTQEQLAIISRLAYADLLQTSGHPTLLMLDDALVHSDAQRLAQMKRVLFDAATRHQVLLFTCKPQDWADAGAAVRSLPTL